MRTLDAATLLPPLLNAPPPELPTHKAWQFNFQHTETPSGTSLFTTVTTQPCLTPSGTHVAVSVHLEPGGGERVRADIIEVWELGSGSMVGVLEGHAAEILGTVVTADGQLLISTSKDATVRVWSLSDLWDKPKYQVRMH